MNATSAAYPSANRGEEADLAGVKTLQKALAILDAFASAERPLTVAEVAVRASITRPTAHRLIQTLVGAGFLAQDPGDSRIVQAERRHLAGVNFRPYPQIALKGELYRSQPLDRDFVHTER